MWSHHLHINVFKVYIKTNIKLFTLFGTYKADILVRSDSFYSPRDSIQCQNHSHLPHNNMKTYNAIQICLLGTHGLKKEMFHFCLKILTLYILWRFAICLCLTGWDLSPKWFWVALRDTNLMNHSQSYLQTNDRRGISKQNLWIFYLHCIYVVWTQRYSIYQIRAPPPLIGGLTPIWWLNAWMVYLFS